MKKYLDMGFVNLRFLLASVWKEHRRQLEKWGRQNRILFEWLAYITEELGELSEAISEYEYRDGDKDNIVKEAIQVATLALKIAEMAKFHTEKAKENGA